MIVGLLSHLETVIFGFREMERRGSILLLFTVSDTHTHTHTQGIAS